MRLLLFIDLDQRMLVGGLNDPNPAELPVLFQGDDVDMTLQGVEKNTSTVVQYYRTVPISFSTIKCAITSGADVPPTDGTIRLGLVGGAAGDVTIPFAPGIAKPALQALLNALPGVTAKGGVKVLTTNAATNIFRVRWNSPTETALFEFRENLLEPKSDTRTNVVPLPNGQMQLLKYRQLPIAFTDRFALPVAPVVKTASVRTGTNTRNCIQSITVPRTALGSVHFTFAGLSTAILPITTLTASAIAGALNDLYADGATRFSVTPASNTVFYVEFVGSLALTDYPVLDAVMHDQVFIDTPTAKLPLNGPTLEMAFDGTAKIERVFEIEITDTAGEVGTPIQTAVSLRNDVIDGGMSLGHDPDWQVPADPSYPPYDPHGAVIVAPGGYITPIGTGVATGTSGTAFVITHNLHTSDCIVEVRETGGQRRRLPDDQYVATYVNDDQIRVDFNVAPTDGQYEIMIAAVKASEMALPHHTHPISDVEGLEEALENLGGEASTAPLPESRLPAHIGWKNPANQYRFDKLPLDLLPDEALRKPLQGSDLPPGTPYYVAGPPPMIVVTLPGPPTQTFPILVGDPTTNPPTWTLPPDRLPDPTKWPGLAQAILLALQAGANLPNAVVFQIDDYTESFPAGFKLSNHCPEDTEIATLPASIIPALLNPGNGGNITDGLPPPSTVGYANNYFTVVGSATSSATIYREAQTFLHGDLIASNGYHWFKVELNGNIAYPKEYMRELFSIYVSPEMLANGSRFQVDFTLQAALVSADLVRGQYLLTLEIGTPQAATGAHIGANLLSVNWYTQIVQEIIILTNATTYHHFSYAVTRNLTTGALTATKGVYAASNLTATAPQSAGFAVRATLTEFDVENIVPNPGGQVTLKMLKPTASVLKLNP